MKKPKSFEEGLQRLQTVLAALQQESTPLADALKLYAEAAELIQYCNAQLQDAQLQIEEIDQTLAAAGGSDA